MDAKQLNQSRNAIAAHLAQLESTLSDCEFMSLAECCAILACKLSEVPSRLSQMRQDASFFRSVLHPVVIPVTESRPDALPSQWSERANRAEGSK